MSQTSSDDEECNSNQANETNRGGRKYYTTYTVEQKIVSAVWMHERPYNRQTMQDVQNNFRIRFKMEPPSEYALALWEKRLFSSGAIVVERNRRRLERLVHVPYVKASLKEKPGLTLSQRACQLGLSQKILRQILKYDIKDNDLSPPKDTNCENVVGNGETQSKGDINTGQIAE